MNCHSQVGLENPALEPVSQIGQALFTMYRCAGCHRDGSAFPPLVGKYGKTVEIEGSGTVVFDDDYIRESIDAPSAKIVAGQRPVMQSYKDQIPENEVKQIILYIRSNSFGVRHSAQQRRGSAVNP